MSKVRILIADEHDLVRRGLRAILETHPGWKVCGEAVTGQEAVEKTKRLRPDIVVMDISMPDLNGLEATRQIVRAVPKTEVLILTAQESQQLVREVLEAGAHGYVLKSDKEPALLAAVEALSRHETFFTSKVSEMVLEGYLGSRNRGLRRDLTTRERQIIQLLAEGKRYKEVAASLGISVKTAEMHRSNIKRKLGLVSLGELIRYAIRNKIVDL